MSKKMKIIIISAIILLLLILGGMVWFLRSRNTLDTGRYSENSFIQSIIPSKQREQKDIINNKPSNYSGFVSQTSSSEPFNNPPPLSPPKLPSTLK